MYDELVMWLRCEECLPYNALRTMREAADAIEKLNRENESLEKDVEIASYVMARRWIPVTERLPEEDGFTLIFTAHGHAGVCYFTNGWWGGYGMDGITHWMPLPTPPTAEEGE